MNEYRINPKILARDLGILIKIFQPLTNYTRRLVENDQENLKFPKAYPYIPFYSIKDIIQVVNRFPKAKTFVDFGSGVPMIPLAINALFGIQSYGYEIRPTIIGPWLITNGHNHVTMIEKSILSLKPEEIQKYDIIYYFRPICDEATLHKFESLIIKNVREGQVIIPIGDFGGLINTPKNKGRFERITNTAMTTYLVIK